MVWEWVAIAVLFGMQLATFGALRGMGGIVNDLNRAIGSLHEALAPTKVKPEPEEEPDDDD